MRALLVLLAIAGTARAEPLPPASMGVLFGGVFGTGADAKRLGIGYIASPLPSFQAAWQPMSTERRVGYSIRWSTMFATHYDASAAQVKDLETMSMDITAGIRVRPGDNPRRYVTGRAGAGLLRANQTIGDDNRRAFYGGVTSVGFQQYLAGTRLLLDFDVRYGLIGGPRELVATAGISINGP
jgi:hypothetical protein